MADRGGGPARVVVIDSGVKLAHPHVRGMGDVVCGPTFNGPGEAEPGEQVDRLGHGTAVAATILEHAPGSWLCSIKVFDDRPECPFEFVLRALKYAIGLQPDLINLSLGTPSLEWKDGLANLLRAASMSGSRIVAPADFQGLPSYPGSLDGADGVVADQAMERGAPARAGGWWRASPHPREIPHIERSRWSGSSFAVANVTGFLARLVAPSSS
ncbi:MAG: S8 family serine peptidase [Planctomycetota bacterium]|nr:S8 family serine peptidase [Planctomycetota bacterium]